MTTVKKMMINNMMNETMNIICNRVNIMNKENNERREDIDIQKPKRAEKTERLK